MQTQKRRDRSVAELPRKASWERRSGSWAAGMGRSSWEASHGGVPGGGGVPIQAMGQGHHPHSL